jgi:tRNA1(Val) A37 N6-methylase TrmN6
MVLIEGRMGGRSGMMLTPPLIIYRDKEHRTYSDEMNYIMQYGSFPDKFRRT